MSDHSEDDTDRPDPTAEYHEETSSPPADTAINPVDEDNQFIFDDDSRTLICVGSHFDDVPQSIIELFAQKTKILDLSKNRFRSLAAIKSFPHLEELILDDNIIDDTHTRFPKLPHLHTLMLNKNHLQDIYKLVEQLRHAYPNLTHLSLLGNEACPYRITAASQTSSTSADLSPYAQNRLEEEYQRYRHLLIFRMPTLKFLDSREISANERRIATQLGDILYSIADTKQSSGITPVEKKYEHYTPLPTTENANNQSRVSVGKLRHTYQGEGSQGNKFVQDRDL